MSAAERWQELVGVALLGTDRRPAPPSPPGPASDVVRDVASARPGLDATEAVLVEVAALTACRRAGLRAGAPVALPVPPEDDPRPPVPPEAAAVLDVVLGEHPVLEDEWLVVAGRAGWRVPGDVAVVLLRRHRHDPERRARVEALAGPLAPWLVEHVPNLAGRGRSAVEPTWELPALTMPPDLVALTRQPPEVVVEVLGAGLRDGVLRPPHRAALAHCVARVPIQALEPLVAVLDEIPPRHPAAGLATALAQLARTRADLHRALDPTRPRPDEELR